MNGHCLQHNFLLRPILLVNIHLLHPLERPTLLSPREHPPKDSVLSIQMFRILKRNKELTRIRSGSFIGHAQHTPCAVPQRQRLDLILEVLTVNRAAAFRNGIALGVSWGEGCVAPLDHEVFDNAVEGGIVVRTGGAEGEEVLGGAWDGFAKDFQLDIAVGGVELWFAVSVEAYEGIDVGLQ